MKSSNDKGPHDDTLPIGDIIGVHGLRGAVKLRSYAESPAFFAPGRQLRLEDREGRLTDETVAWAQPHGKGLLLALEGVADRDAAEALVGCRLRVSKASLPKLEEGTYYWFELIGLVVYTTGGRHLGTLEAVMSTGSNDVYVVRKGDEEVLVPALASVVQKIDPLQGRMDVILPEGL